MLLVEQVVAKLLVGVEQVVEVAVLVVAVDRVVVDRVEEVLVGLADLLAGLEVLQGPSGNLVPLAPLPVANSRWIRKTNKMRSKPSARLKPTTALKTWLSSSSASQVTPMLTIISVFMEGVSTFPRQKSTSLA